MISRRVGTAHYWVAPPKNQSWRELLPLVGHVPTARRRLELGKIRKLHPAQLADLLEQASEDEGKEIFGALQADPEFEADVVEEMEPNRRREALREKTDNELGELLGTMEPDDAVDMLLSLDQDRRENVLALIPKPQQKDVKRLLLYHPDTAGGIMTTDFITVRSSDTVEACCEALRLKPELPGNLWSIPTAFHPPLLIKAMSRAITSLGRCRGLVHIRWWSSKSRPIRTSPVRLSNGEN